MKPISLYLSCSYFNTPLSLFPLHTSLNILLQHDCQPASLFAPFLLCQVINLSSLSVTPVKSSSEMSYSCKEPSRTQRRRREEGSRGGGGCGCRGGGWGVCRGGGAERRRKKKMRKMTTRPRNIPPLDSTSQVLEDEILMHNLFICGATSLRCRAVNFLPAQTTDQSVMNSSQPLPGDILIKYS